MQDYFWPPVEHKITVHAHDLHRYSFAQADYIVCEQNKPLSLITALTH